MNAMHWKIVYPHTYAEYAMNMARATEFYTGSRVLRELDQAHAATDLSGRARRYYELACEHRDGVTS